MIARCTILFTCASVFCALSRSLMKTRKRKFFQIYTQYTIQQPKQNGASKIVPCICICNVCALCIVVQYGFIVCTSVSLCSMLLKKVKNLCAYDLFKRKNFFLQSYLQYIYNSRTPFRSLASFFFSQSIIVPVCLHFAFFLFFHSTEISDTLCNFVMLKNHTNENQSIKIRKNNSKKINESCVF